MIYLIRASSFLTLALAVHTTTANYPDPIVGAAIIAWTLVTGAWWWLEETRP